jgi:hypothetical protein
LLPVCRFRISGLAPLKSKYSTAILLPNLVAVQIIWCNGSIRDELEKTCLTYLLLKRIEADLSQPELAIKSGVTVRKVKA